MKNNFLQHFCIVLLAVSVCIHASAVGDKTPAMKEVTKDKAVEPDVLPVPLASEKRMMALPEASLHEETPIAMHAGLVPSERYGIDVSHYQGRIDWNLVAQDPNVTFAYLKATEGGGYVDDTYSRNLQEARRVGIPVGSYHFFSPTASAQQQLLNFCQNIDMKKQDLLPIIDVEVLPRDKNVAAFRRRLVEFMHGVEQHIGTRPIIYTGQNFYNKYLAGLFPGYMYMFAKYTGGQPLLDDMEIHFVLWQFTATGTVSGIRGKVDRSCFMDNYKVRHIRYKGK